MMVSSPTTRTAGNQFSSQKGSRKNTSTGKDVDSAPGVAAGPLVAGITPASRTTSPRQNSTQAAGGQIFGCRTRR